MIYLYICIISYYIIGIMWFVYINFNKINYIYIPNRKEFINND